MLLKQTIKSMSVIIFLAGMVFNSTGIIAQVFELRTYTTNPGKLEDLHARFKNHTINIFNKHGMKSVGYWVPIDEKRSKNTLIYVLEHTSLDTAKSSWKAFGSDPAWHKVAKESQLDGKILAEAPDSVFMTAAGFSPAFSNRIKGGDGVFELRTYKTNPGKLSNLNSRFRDNTVRIFNRFGMESVAYWHPVKEPDSTDTLIYILRHDSADAAKKSWSDFINDKEWKKVAEESQLGGRILRARPESVFMRAADYSEIR